MGKDLKGRELGKGIRQRPDGKYYARFSSISGKRPESSFDRLQDARLWLEDQRYLDKHGGITAPSYKITDDWWRYWIENIKSPTVSSGTAKGYEEVYGKHIRPLLGPMRLEDVKPLHCQSILNGMASRYCQGYIRKVMQTMAQLFDSAVDNQLILKSPVTKLVKMPRIQNESKERRVLTKKEQCDLVEYMNTHKCSYRNQFLLILETGMRIGELSGLKWPDIDFKGRRILIRRTMVYKMDGNGFSEHPPKTKHGERTIPMTQKAYEILNSVRHSKVNGIYVFINRNNRPIVNTDYRLSLVRMCKRIGIEPISPHTLRHTFATRCIENGMRPKTLQKILGHASLTITMDLYVHVTEETIFEEMRKMDQVV